MGLRKICTGRKCEVRIISSRITNPRANAAGVRQPTIHK